MALEDVAWPEQLRLATRWRRLDNGGAADIREWAGTVAKPRLVILDTLAFLVVLTERTPPQSVCADIAARGR